LENKDNPASIKARKEMGTSHTWEASVNKIYSLISNIENG